MNHDTTKIKVLHIISSFGIGGMENGLVNIINHSRDKSIDHEICCISESGKSEQRLNRKIRIYELNKGRESNVQFILKLVHTIRSINPDIVHTRSWAGVDGILAAKIAGVTKIIHGEHGWSPEDPRGMNVKRRIIRWLVFHLTHRVVAVSEDIRQWLIQRLRVNPVKIKKIINAVDTDRFRPVANEEILVQGRKRHGIPEGKTVLGIVARLDPIKRHDLLIRAVKELEHPDIVLVVVGDGPVRTQLEKMAKDLNMASGVLFLGEQDNLQDLYPLLDILVLPSDNEGISNTILEAMACGLPIVASRTGGNVELVAGNQNGLLFEPGNLQDLVKALKYYLNTREKMEAHGRKSRALALRDYAISRMVAGYETMYQPKDLGH